MVGLAISWLMKAVDVVASVNKGSRPRGLSVNEGAWPWCLLVHEDSRPRGLLVNE